MPPQDIQHARYFPVGSLALKPDVPGASYWAVALQHTMLTYFEVASDTSFPEHQHESEQITFVLEGTLIFHLGGREIRVGPGVVIAIPGNVPHGVNGGPHGAKAVDAWSPVRAEYRAGDHAVA